MTAVPKSKEHLTMGIKTKPFDAAKHFPDAEAQAALICDALATGHAGYIAAAFGTVAKVRGIAEVAEETGLNRQTLHRALSEDGNPTLETLLKVTQALGLQLKVEARRDAEESVAA